MDISSSSSASCCIVLYYIVLYGDADADQSIGYQSINQSINDAIRNHLSSVFVYRFIASCYQAAYPDDVSTMSSHSSDGSLLPVVASSIHSSKQPPGERVMRPVFIRGRWQ